MSVWIVEISVQKPSRSGPSQAKPTFRNDTGQTKTDRQSTSLRPFDFPVIWSSREPLEMVIVDRLAFIWCL